MILGWNRLWAAELNQRNPSLVILAYGTTEAASATWKPAQYHADLSAVIARIRRAAPARSNPDDRPPGLRTPPASVAPFRVIDIQREIAQKERVAFWDWRMHMGGPGIITRCVEAGLSQPDYVHLTAEGYRLVGKMVFDQLEHSH